MKRHYWLFGILLGIPLLCIGTFVFGHYYGQWRMETARTEMFELAAMLGYEPAAHLLDSVESSNASLVDGSRRCAATLLYTTPLSVEEFVEQLNQLPWKGVDYTGRFNDWSTLYMAVDLTVNGLRYEDDWAAYANKFIGVHHRIWGLEGKSVHIYFYDITALGVQLERQGQPFTQNVVYVRVSRGVFPIWLNCPTQFNRETSAAF
jgi:hypothetical protein